MSDLEHRLRTALEGEASRSLDEADVRQAVAERIVTSRVRYGTSGRPARWVSPLAAAAAVLAVVGAGVLWSHHGDGNPSPASAGPQNVSRSNDQVASDSQLEQYVNGLTEQYPGLNASVDRPSRTILIAAPTPISGALKARDGTHVGDYVVDVFPASVTVAAYDAFIQNVAEATFPDHARVTSFNLPQGSDYIEVKVAGLDKMSDEDAAALKLNLEELTDCRLELTTAPTFVD